jgi:hypothetical protein
MIANSGAGVDFKQKTDRRRAVATVAALLAVLAADASVAGDGGDCPPNPELGKCYEKVYLPAQYEDQAEQVLDQPARVETRTIEAVYRLQQKEVLVRQASAGAPAVYKTVSEPVLVTPARVERYTAPATYRLVMTRRVLREASFDWRTIACEGPARRPSASH